MLIQQGFIPNELSELWSVVIRPWVVGSITLSARFGLIPECHGQNCLLVIDPASRTVGVALRDLGDVFVDLSLRSARGMDGSFPSYKTIIEATDSDYYQRRSFAYDSKLSGYLIKPLLKAFSNVAGVDCGSAIQYVRARCLEEWVVSGVEPTAFFGGTTWYHYPDKPQPGRRDYVEGEGAPLFR